MGMWCGHSFLIGGALLFLVVLSSSLTVQGLHFHHRPRPFHPLRRGCGRTVHVGDVQELIMFEAEHTEESDLGDEFSHNEGRQGGIRSAICSFFGFGEGSHDLKPDGIAPDDGPEEEIPHYRGPLGRARNALHFVFGIGHGEYHGRPEGVPDLGGDADHHHVGHHCSLMRAVKSFFGFGHGGHHPRPDEIPDHLVRQGGFVKPFHHKRENYALAKFRWFLHQGLDRVWPWRMRGARKEIIVAKPWQEEFVVNFTTKFGAATGFLAYDWAQRRQVIYHGEGSTYCSAFDTQDACQMMEIGSGTYSYVPSLEKCVLSVEGVGTVPPDWTTYSEYVGTKEFPGVGLCRGFAFPPTVHIYYETVDGDLPCAFVFPEPSSTYFFQPETFKVGTPEEKYFDFPDYCFEESSTKTQSIESSEQVLRSAE